MVEDYEIWPRVTGITDLPAESSLLALQSMQELRVAWAEQRKSLRDKQVLSSFTEQLNRMWAIETGQIENLYNIERGVTQALIEHGIQSSLLEPGSVDKPPDYVIRIIQDQHDALDGLFQYVKQERPLTVSYIKDLHAAMTRSQLTTEALDSTGAHIEIPLRRGEWKIHPNFPVFGGRRFMYCPPEQTQSEMERLVEMHHRHVELGLAAEIQAAWLHHRFTQIHPFQDGNGRVARALATLVLIKAGMFPLVVSRDDKDEYLRLLELADRGNLRPFILFLGRLQDAQYQRARITLARSGVPPSSAVEAAEALGVTLRHGIDHRKAQVISAMNRIHAEVIQRVEQVFSSAIETLRAVQPGDYPYQWLHKEVQDDQLPRTLLDYMPELESTGTPYLSSRLSFHLNWEHLLDIYTAAPNGDPDGRIASIAAVSFEGRLEIVSHVWLSDSPGHVDHFAVHELAGWSDRVVSKFIHEVHTNL